MAAYLFTALFYLFLFLLMCVTSLCGHVCGDAGGEGPHAAATAATNFIKLFDKSKISKEDKVLKPDGGELSEGEKQNLENIEIKDYYSPVILSTNNVIVALAGVNRSEESEKNITVLTNFIEKEKVLSADDVKNTKNYWNTQFAAQSENKIGGSKELVKCLLAVANQNEIYLLLVNQTKKTESPDDYELLLMLAVGTVNDKEKGPEKQVKWSKNKLTAESKINELTNKFQKEKLAEYPFGGSAFLTSDEKILFALVVESAAKKKIALISFKKSETEPESFYTKDVGNCYPYLFPWGDKIIMVLADCAEEKTIMESSNMGQTWENSAGAFSRQYGFLKDKKHFTTTKIGNTSVLLFTEEKTKTSNKEVNLWMSDGNRSRKVWTIILEPTETFYGSILHEDKNLFLLYQKYKAQTGLLPEINNILFTKLKDPLDEIQKAIKAWNKNNDDIQKLCKLNTVTTCSTDGLVGFLTTTEDSKHWKDVYLNVHAIIHGGSGFKKNGDDEVTFSGTGAGAVWRVGKTDENEQPYNLKDSGFSLVATVKINGKANKKGNSMLGIGLKEGGGSNVIKRISLWCSDEGKWAVGKKEDLTNLVPNNAICEQNEAYLVMLMLKKDSSELEVYIDGNKLKITQTDAITFASTEIISHFYFGVDEDQNTVETQVSIKNVLLYNRPLNPSEIDGFKIPEKKKVTNPEETDSGNNTSGQQSDNSTDKNNKESGGTNNKQTSPSSPTTEDSAVSVAVDVLSLLFCVFTLLGRYVY